MLTWTLWYPCFDPILAYTGWNLDIHVPVYVIKILAPQFLIICTGDILFIHNKPSAIFKLDKNETTVADCGFRTIKLKKSDFVLPKEKTAGYIYIKKNYAHFVLSC